MHLLQKQDQTVKEKNNMFEYEEALQDYNLTYDMLSTKLKQKINYLKLLQKQVEKNPSKKIELDTIDLVIADEIQTFVEEEFEEEILTPNNNMTEEQKALQARATALGLAETATEAEILAEEQKIADKAKADQEAADKAAQDAQDAQAKADQEAADKAAKDAQDAADQAAKEAKDKADQEAAEKAKAAEAKRLAEEDILDDLGL